MSAFADTMLLGERLVGGKHSHSKDASLAARRCSEPKDNVRGTKTRIGVAPTGDEIQGSPLVSVVVPTRGGREILTKCVESILGSSYNPIEVILVDDFSEEDVGKVFTR